MNGRKDERGQDGKVGWCFVVVAFNPHPRIFFHCF